LWNGFKVTPQSPLGPNGAIVSSQNDVGADAIFKALNLLCDKGVMQFRFQAENGMYVYDFPSNPQTTPWASLAVVPRKNAIKISDNVLRFPSYPGAVLVLVTVGANKLECDSARGEAQIVSLLQKLKTDYSLVSVGFTVREHATYKDMMAALHAAKLADIKSYYFSDRTAAIVKETP